MNIWNEREKVSVSDHRFKFHNNKLSNARWTHPPCWKTTLFLLRGSWLANQSISPQSDWLALFCFSNGSESHRSEITELSDDSMVATILSITLHSLFGNFSDNNLVRLSHIIVLWITDVSTRIYAAVQKDLLYLFSFCIPRQRASRLGVKGHLVHYVGASANKNKPVRGHCSYGILSILGQIFQIFIVRYTNGNRFVILSSLNFE